VSIEPEAEKDLALDTEDAENVVGGQKKKQKKGHKPPPKTPTAATGPVQYTGPAGTDPPTPPSDPDQWGTDFGGEKDIGF
jgi:hypothetical protein